MDNIKDHNLKTENYKKGKRIFRISWRWEYFLVVILIAECIIFGTLAPRFLNPIVLLNSINNYIPVCIIALFVTFVMITGGIDIQAGSIIGLSSICVGVLWQKMGVNIWLAMLCGLIIGAICGLFSGAIIAYTNIQPMVVTLGGSFLFSGIALVVPGLAKVVSYQGVTNFPQSFVNIAEGSLFGVPNQVIIFGILTVIAYVILHKTQYGRKIFLIGVNKRTAEYSGIKSSGIIISTYVLSGTAAALAGILLTSYLGTARPDYGSDLTLPIITAVVLGGTSILGGRGNVIGTALASLVIGFLEFGLQLVGIAAQYLDIPVGFLLIISLIINSFASEGLISKIIKKAIRREKVR